MSLITDKKFLFIIGAPRSGSTWLQKILEFHPHVASTNAELTLFNRYVHPAGQQFEIEETAIKKGKWSQGLPHLISKAEFDSGINMFLETVYGRFDHITATHILDKHPHYSEVVDTIHYYIPGARFLHIVRDGRDMAISWNQAYHKLGFGAKTIQLAARDWKNFVRNAQHARKFNELYLEIRYNDLLQNPEMRIKMIYEFCSLPYDDDLIYEAVKATCGDENMVSAPDNNVSLSDRMSGRGGWNQKMSVKDRILFDREAGDLLFEYGFTSDRKWLGNNGQVFLAKTGLFFNSVVRKLKKSIGAWFYG